MPIARSRTAITVSNCASDEPRAVLAKAVEAFRSLASGLLVPGA